MRTYSIEVRPAQGAVVLRRTCDGAFLAAVWCLNGGYYLEIANLEVVLLGRWLDYRGKADEFCRPAGVSTPMWV